MTNILANFMSYVPEQASTISYDISATLIFMVMSFCFLFPCNNLIPLDRRTAAVFAATLVYLTRSFLFSDRPIKMEDAVDFEVLILLASIMAINFIVVHQQETKKLILTLQEQINTNPRKGFWLVSFAAFAVSPFLTNDGVCLLFVEPILKAFDNIEDEDTNVLTEEGHSPDLSTKVMKLRREDAFYFMIALACSSNIGSALTYTGNPQNMIVAHNSIDVLPPYAFLGYMIIPSLISWGITMHCIQHFWLQQRDESSQEAILKANRLESGVWKNPCICYSDESNSQDVATLTAQAEEEQAKALASLSPKSKSKAMMLRNSVATKIASYIVASPFPSAMFLLMIAMIILIFCDIISIAGLVCVSSMIMVVVTVCGNFWTGRTIWYAPIDTNAPRSENHEGQLSSEEKIENTNEFFENLFNSIDYNLLMIFLGTFIVVENIDSTGLPGKIFSTIVGSDPFGNFSSVVGICIFVLLSSQFLGNVAVIQLVAPNISGLSPSKRRLAWAVISFVATVGGNLTITGSAANIIVSEKAQRLGESVEFFGHFKVCFWITILSCAIGMGCISATATLDSMISGY